MERERSGVSVVDCSIALLLLRPLEEVKRVIIDQLLGKNNCVFSCCYVSTLRVSLLLQGPPIVQ